MDDFQEVQEFAQSRGYTPKHTDDTQEGVEL
jgi:hypothetical protein